MLEFTASGCFGRTIAQRFVLVLFGLTFLLVGPAQAQQQPDMNGIHPGESLGPDVHTPQTGDTETVDLSTGELSVFIPVLQLPQKGGGTLTLGYPILQNQYHPSINTSLSNHLNIDPDDTNYPGGEYVTDYLYNVGLVSGTTGPILANLPTLRAAEVYAGQVKDLTQIDILSYDWVFCLTDFTFSDWQGHTHKFNNIRSCSFKGGNGTPYWGGQGGSQTIEVAESEDDTLYRLDTTNPADIIVTAKDGTQYHFANLTDPYPDGYSVSQSSSEEFFYQSAFTSINDVNGNTITAKQTADDPEEGPTYEISDTLNRTIKVAPDGISYFDSNGTKQQISDIYTTDTSAPGETVWPDFYCYITNPPDPNDRRVSQITLPNSTDPFQIRSHTEEFTLPGSRKYTLSFNGLGQLTKIRYPSGGYTRYDYQKYVTRPLDSGAPISCVGDTYELSHKYQCDDSAGSCSTEDSWTYSLGDTTGTFPIPTGTGAWSVGPPYNWAMSVIDPFGTTTAHIFGWGSDLSAALGTDETDLVVVDAAGKKLRGIHKTFTLSDRNELPTPVSLVSTLLETDYETSSSKKTTYTYQTANVPFYFPNSNPNTIIDNPLETDEYGFDGKLIRSTVNVWMTGGSFDPGTAHILDKLTSSTVTDASSGVAHVVTTGYDAKGNVTSQGVGGTGTSTLTTTYNLDASGRPSFSIDPAGSKTTYSYSDNWKQASCVQASSADSQAFLTSVTDALNHTISTAYNSCTGTVAAISGPNAGQTTLFQYDSLGRKTDSSLPDGGHIHLQFDDGFPNKITTTTRAAPDPDINNTTTLDGLGRTLISDLSALSVVDTSYDALSRITSRSNPHAPSENPVYTTYIYDALDRLVKTTNPDGTFRGACYNGVASPGVANCPTNASSFQDATRSTTFVDEAGLARQYSTDAFNRLRQVTEPDAARNTLAYVTQYVYDAFGNLTLVNQSGDGSTAPRRRSFTYDGLSRLLASNNPETGSLSYKYALQGGGICAGDASLPCTKTDANGVVTTYRYDAVNRLNRKSFSDGSSQGFGYDGLDENGQALPNGFSSNAIGRLSRSSNEINSATNYGFDLMGRTTAKADINPHSAQSFSDNQVMKYDLAGNVIYLQYPDGRQLSEVYDAAGRLTNATDVTGGAQGTQYLNITDFWPNGTSRDETLGNGVVVHHELNSRLQPSAISANSPALPTVSGHSNVFDKSILYASVNQPNNNGNILSIIDNLRLKSDETQSFGYDALNRLTWANRNDGAFNQQYSYDPFGNMLMIDSVNPQVNFNRDVNPTNRMYLNNNTTDIQYNNAGQLTDDPFRHYQYNPDGYLSTITSGGSLVAQYTYNGEGERTGKVTSTGGWTDYVYLNGQPLAEQDQSGNWTDYVYAGNSKIAQVSMQASATSSSTTPAYVHVEANMGGGWIYFALGGSLNYTISDGDLLAWSQRVSGGGVGGPNFETAQTGVNDPWYMNDQNGEALTAQGPTSGWVDRTVDLSADAGQTLTTIAAVLEYPSLGPSSMDLANLCIWHTRPVRAVSTCFITQPIAPSVIFNNSPNSDSNPQSSYVPATQTPGTSVVDATHYFIDDQLGTTQIQLDATGKPEWQGEYAPFGQDISRLSQPFSGYTPDGVSTHYKFTGKERDAESGLDYFGARYYSSSMGRFTSPDKPLADQHAEDPQSWNLYSYVRNNPLNAVDPTGEAVLLVQAKTQEQAQALVDIYRQQLVRGEGVGRLYANWDERTKGWYVGISGDHSDFAKKGPLESNVQTVVDSTEITDFIVGKTVTEKCDNCLFDKTVEKNVSQEYGGAVTESADIMPSGHSTQVIDPTGILDRSNAPKPTVGEAMAHETGHKAAQLHGHKGNYSNSFANDAENEARRRGGTDRGERHGHFGGTP